MQTTHRLLAVALFSAATALAYSQDKAPDPVILGPMIGFTEATETTIWLRTGQRGGHMLSVRERGGDSVFDGSKTAIPDTDLTVRWSVSGLEPETEYIYDFILPDGRLHDGDDFVFRTPPKPEAKQRVTIALGARASTESSPVWTRIQAERADALVLLGDSPAIDTTDLAVARERQRALLSVPEFARLVRTTPTLATWDDRDYGELHAGGNLKGKYNTRRAFTEYHASREFGQFDEGVYTSFRMGPIEVFLVDTRYFTDLETALVAPSEPSLLGHEQWNWLTHGLSTSTAKFKLIASGRLWDYHPDRTNDDWQAYAQERDPLIYQLGQAGVSGVVLAAGDLGASRAMIFPVSESLGYDAWQFIPGSLSHETDSPPATHTAMVHQASEPGVFLKLIADSTVSPATLTATWITANGDRLFSVTTDEKTLSGSVLLDRP